MALVPSVSPNLARSTIVVADDDSTIRLVIAAFLEDLGCTVKLARHGVEALDHALSDLVHLVLTNDDMPELDGVARCQELRRHPSTCPYQSGS